MGKSRENKKEKKDEEKIKYTVKVSFGNAKLEYCINNIVKAMENKMEQDIEAFENQRSQA
jgi:hypothetical protein